MSGYITCPHCGLVRNPIDRGGFTATLEERGGQCISCGLNVHDAPKRSPIRMSVVDPIDQWMSDERDRFLRGVFSDGAKPDADDYEGPWLPRPSAEEPVEDLRSPELSKLAKVYKITARLAVVLRPIQAFHHDWTRVTELWIGDKMVTLPEWAKWLCVYADGEVFAINARPAHEDYGRTGWWLVSGMRWAKLGNVGRRNDWRETLCPLTVEAWREWEAGK